MRSRLLFVVFVNVAASCGGGAADDVVVFDDAITGGTDDCLPSSGCNPLSPPGMQGCLGGEKCTWIRVQETPVQLGVVGCVPAGAVELGGACTVGPVTGTPPVCGSSPSSTGYDDCAGGLYCINNTCQDICGFDGSANAACSSGFSCTRYADTFANGDDDPIAGICNPSCDPLTTDCGPNMGCYLLTNQAETIAVCARAGMVMHNQDITGQHYANSCVPGAQPRRKDPASQTVQCGGLCKMVDVSQGVNEADEGGQVTASTTDKDQCVGSWGASPPQDGTAGESCRYWWAREPFDALSPYSNTVGWCYKHAVFQFDSNLDMTPDTPFPRCTTLTAGDTVLPTNGTPDNLYFWCVASPPPMLSGAVRNTKAFHARIEPKADRLVDWSRRAR